MHRKGFLSKRKGEAAGTEKLCVCVCIHLDVPIFRFASCLMSTYGCMNAQFALSSEII